MNLYLAESAGELCKALRAERKRLQLLRLVRRLPVEYLRALTGLPLGAGILQPLTIPALRIQVPPISSMYSRLKSAERQESTHSCR
jgi:hypothetical protein